MAFDLDTYQRLVRPVDLDGIDFSAFSSQPLDEEVLRCLRYMHDVESHTGCRPSSFCYPFGSFDDASVAAVRHHYAHALTTRYGLLGTSPDPHLLPRLDCFYFREPGALERRWGRRWFATRVRTRAVARATRTRLSSRRVR